MDELFELLGSPFVFFLIMLFVVYRFVKRGLSGANETRKKIEQAQRAQARARRQGSRAAGTSGGSGAGDDRTERIFELLQERLEQAAGTSEPSRPEKVVGEARRLNEDGDTQLLAPQEQRRMSGESTSLVSGSSSGLLGGDYPMPSMGGRAPIGTGSIAGARPGGSIAGAPTGGSITGRSLFDDADHRDDHSGDEMSGIIAGGAALDATGDYDFHIAEQMSAGTVDSEEARVPVEVAPIAPTLRDPAELRRAFILKEILDKPRAMRR